MLDPGPTARVELFLINVRQTIRKLYKKILLGDEIIIYLTPVSYTHLDVYKRQDQIHQRMNISILKFLCTMCGEIPEKNGRREGVEVIKSLHAYM